ncbi:hypothetical protein [Thiolapillus sp.]
MHGVNFTLGSADLDAQFQAIQAVMDSHQGPIVMAGVSTPGIVRVWR